MRTNIQDRVPDTSIRHIFGTSTDPDPRIITPELRIRNLLFCTGFHNAKKKFCILPSFLTGYRVRYLP